MNNDLISRSALIAVLDEKYERACIHVLTRETRDEKSLWEGISTGTNGARNAVWDAPAVDAVEVVHGKWIWNGKHWECSNCRHDRLHDLVLGLDAAYCPYCGAKMDGERKDGGKDD